MKPNENWADFNDNLQKLKRYLILKMAISGEWNFVVNSYIKK